MADDTEELIALCHEWDRAKLQNDPVAIGRFMADDWMSANAAGAGGNKAAYLAEVEYTDLIFQYLATQVQEVRVHGDTAVVAGEVDEEIYIKGYPYHSKYRTSLVFVREDGRWLCLATHKW